MRVIENAVAAIGLHDFLERYWDKGFVHVPATPSSNSEIDDLLKQLSSFLDRNDIRYPSLRVAKDGKEVPLEKYTKTLRIGPHHSNDLIVNDIVFGLYSAGSTIILQLLQNSLPSFGVAANRLEEFFGANIHASCFITPPHSQGFTPHYDTYSFFVVQLFGSKQWSLFNSTAALPLPDDRMNEAPWTPTPPLHQLTLDPGDVLYVPRGLYHSAVASSTASVHITVGVFSSNWLDVTKEAIDEIGTTALFRRSTVGPESFQTRSQDLGATQDELTARIDLKVGLQRLQQRVFAKHIDARAGRFLDLLALSAGEPFKAFVRQPVPFILSGKPDRIFLRFANKELGFPRFIDPILATICGCDGVFEADSLPRILDDNSLQVLLRKLVAEGFLRPADTSRSLRIVTESV